MKLEWAVMAGAALIAVSVSVSVLFIGRYQISAVGFGYLEDGRSNVTQNVYRLDRWNGEIRQCGADMHRMSYVDFAKRMEKQGYIDIPCEISGYN